MSIEKLRKMKKDDDGLERSSYLHKQSHHHYLRRLGIHEALRKRGPLLLNIQVIVYTKSIRRMGLENMDS